ncbi:MAG: histone deacetylase family protein [Pseudomonadota bacterium]
MKVIFHEAQRAHYPQHFLVAGLPRPSPEQPARIDALLSGACAAGLEVSAPRDHGLGPIAAVHTSEYLAFLQTIHDRWQQLDGAAPEVIPNVHPDRRMVGYPIAPVGQAGYHMADTACPIGPETWKSAYWSAQSAIQAVDAVMAGDRAVYALCRPPGHHAFADFAGGFCFLNNTAVAAERAARQGLRVATLDLDLHHGNGTQCIFYGRGDVLTVSIHADPAVFYPFFWGHSAERGEGAGLGANLNLPLPLGAGDDGFLSMLDKAADRIAAFAPDLLVVALGLDAFAGDPFGGLVVTAEGFREIGKRVARISHRCVLVQEGGYLSPELGNNLNAFLNGFKDGADESQLV